MNHLPYACQTITQDDIDAVMKVLKSDWITQGPTVQAFEQALCDYTGARYCTAVSNGTAALYLSCRALGVDRHSVGVTSPLSFAASANCIALCGGRPSFVDIDPDTLCLHPQSLQKYCKESRAPDVVIPVDFAGVPADLETIHAMSIEYGFRVIEDAAHSIGSAYMSGKRLVRCGSCEHSHVAIFSFHPVKNITSAEGGAVLTNDQEIHHRVRKLANHGIERDRTKFSTTAPHKGWYYELQEISFNFRLSDIHAALGLSQLGRIEEFKQKRRQLYNIYSELLSPLERHGLITLPSDPEGMDICRHLYVIRLSERARVSRQELYEAMKASGIGTQVHYWPIHLQPAYTKQYGFAPGDFPCAEGVARACLSIPFFPSMTREQAVFVAERLTGILTA